MTLPTGSNAISLGDVNTEVAAANGTLRSLEWVKNNSAFADADMGNLHGQTFFAAVSSTNNVTRASRTSTVTNCVTNCATQTNAIGFDGAGGWTNCHKIANTNCDQCSFTHGGSLIQGQCNCNCNCWVCNCYYSNCNCNCNCYCGDCAGCFVAGDRVLMADGKTWRAVELLKEGDWLMGANWLPARLKLVTNQVITPNVLIAIGDLVVTGDHAMWVKDEVGEGFWVFDKELWLQVVSEERIGGLKNNDLIKTSAEGQPVTFAHLDGWLTVVPRVIERGVERRTYTLKTESSIPVIVEGFVAAAETNERNFERVFGHGYSGLAWNSMWGAACH